MATSSMTYKLFGHDVSASKTMKNVGKNAAGVASGLGVALAASKVVDWAKQSMTAFEDVGKETLKMKRYIGGSAEDASRLGFAFKMSGVDIDSATKGIGILEKHLSANDKAAKALGISFKDSTGKIKPMGELLPQIAEKFKNMPDGAEKSALAMQLFGKNGMAMLPFLNKGAAGIKDLMAQSDALGNTMSGKDLDSLKAYTKAKREWGAAIKGVQVSLGRALYPTLTKLATTILPMVLPKIQGFVQELGKAPELIEAKWPVIERAIRGVFDRLSEVQGAVKANWPQIKDTFGRVGDAMKRVGEWTKYLWDTFQSLPGPVKELIALLAIAQKTGVLSIAFKGLDLAKNLLMKLTGMNVQAGVVNVNGGGVPGKGGGAAKGGGGLAAVGSALGSPAAVAALVAAAVGVSTWYYLTHKTTPGQTAADTPGSSGVGSLAGTYGGGGGMNAPAYSDADVRRRIETMQKYARAVRDGNKPMFDRVRALKAFRDMGLKEIQTLRDSGASTEDVTAKIEEWRTATWSQAKALGWTDDEAGRYIVTLGKVPKKVNTSITAELVNDAVATATSWASQLTSIPTTTSTTLTATKVADAMDTVSSWVSTLTGVPPTVSTSLTATKVAEAMDTVTGWVSTLTGVPATVSTSLTATKVAAAMDTVSGWVAWLNGTVPGSKTVDLLADTASAVGAVASFVRGIPTSATTRLQVVAQTAASVADAIRKVIPTSVYTKVLVSNGAVALRAASEYALGLAKRISSSRSTTVYLNARPAADAALGMAGWLQRNLGKHTVQIYANIGPAASSALALADKINQIFGRSSRASVASVSSLAVTRTSAVAPVAPRTTVVNINVTGTVFGSKEQMARTVVAALQDARNRGLQLDLAR